MAQNNPLRSGAFLVNLPNTIAELQKKFAAFNSELNQLPDELESERRAIVAARRRDERLSNKTIELEPIDGDEITAYLLRSQVVKQLDELIKVMRWVRDKIPEKRAIGLRGQRGEDVLFTGCREQPNFLVRAIELQGSARIANQPVELRGVLSNFTTLTALYDEPIQLRLEGHGAMPVELKATINRANGALRDELLVDCQSILLPALELGHSDQVAMTIAPSTASISIRAAVDGDKLVGEVQMVQQNVRIVPTVKNAFGRVPIADALEESLGHIDSFATRISLGGTLAEPSCALWSNLGPAVTEAMEHAVRRGSSQHMRAMIVDAGKQVDEQLTGIERQMIEQQTQWQTRIVDVRARLQAIAAAEEPSDRLTPDRLGRRLPSNSLFR